MTRQSFEQFMLAVNPFTIEEERYRTTKKLINEVPGSAADRRLREFWAADNRHQQFIRLNRRLVEMELQKQRDVAAKRKLARERNEQYKARTNTGPYSLAGKGET